MPSKRPSLPPYQDDKGRWRCGAYSRRNDGPCSQFPLKGASHHRCRLHGGKATQTVVKQLREDLEARARLLIPPNSPPVEDPIERLYEIAGECDAFRGSVAQLVNDLNGKIRFTDDKSSEQLRAEVAVYEKALDRVARVLVDINKLRLEERMVQIRESEARALAAALDAGLLDAGVEPSMALSVKQHTARHLRLAV